MKAMMTAPGKNGFGSMRGEVRLMSSTKRKNSGSTMVEVLIGFTLLMIIFAGFTKLIKLSDSFVKTSKDMQYETEFLEEKMYGEEPTAVHDGISMVEAESYSGDGSMSQITLNDVTLETYETDGNNGHIYINRFSHKAP
jgi:Tfp pilus assembly protein PilV